MEPNTPNNMDDDSELLRNLRNAANLPQEESGLPKKRKIQIVIATLCSFAVVVLLVFISSGKKVEKPGKALAVNRGLMQAEAIRRQKELLDDKRKKTDEEEWVKRFRAMKDTASKNDVMPDPTPLFPESSRNPAQPIQRIVNDEQGVQSDSLLQDFHAHKPSPDRFAKLDFHSKNANPMLERMGNMRETPTESQGFKPSPQMMDRMSDEYQKALAYNSSEQLVYTKDRGSEIQKSAAPAKVQPAQGGAVTKVAVSAGDELRAVLTESISSDYPSVVKASLTSPAELTGATLLLSYSLGEERVAAQVVKLILPKKDGDRAKELTLSAVVKSGLPGLGGDVSHHWIPQIAAGLANAGLTAGALAYASQNQNKDLGTAVLVAPMIEQSVQGVLKPINYLGRDRPVTVNVPAGTEFTLLVTEGFEVDL